MVINAPDRITKTIGNVTKYLTNVVAKHIPCLTCYFLISQKIGCLTLKAPNTVISKHCIYPDETAHNGLSHLDIQCLP